MSGTTMSAQEREQWVALNVCWDVSSLPRVQKCRRIHLGADGRMITCGSVWACPVCSAKIMAVRRQEVRAVVDWARAQGYVIAFGTKTVRHRKSHFLAVLWSVASRGHTKTNQNGSVRHMREALGQIGNVRSVDITYGHNGWYVHIHELRFFPAGTTQADVDRLDDAEFEVWRTNAEANGFVAPLRERTKLCIVNDTGETMADYFTKNVYDPAATAVTDVSGHESVVKKGRRTPWQILHSLRETHATVDFNMADRLLWNEYEQASKGKRAITWSRGLKRLAAVDEIEDEEISDGARVPSAPLVSGVDQMCTSIEPRPVRGVVVAIACIDAFRRFALRC